MSASADGDGKVPGFDPEHDTARTQQGGKIRDMYQKLKGRGETEAAAELRRVEDLEEQFNLAEEYPEFDPKHDTARTSTRATVASAYSWLVENDHGEAAADLRQIGTVREQMNRTQELREEVGLPRRGNR